MAWYTTGTVTVTASNNTVTGSGTNFIANARVGDAFRGPDGRWYEVTNIASATAISISPVYQGGTASGQAYSIAPMQGYVKASADALRQITDTYGSTLAALQPWSTAATASIALDNLGFGAIGKAIAAAATTATAQTAIDIVKTTSATDTTAGRVWRTNDLVKNVSASDDATGRMVTVGHAGMGLGTAIALPGNDANLARGSAHYFTDSSTLNPPSSYPGQIINLARSVNLGTGAIAFGSQLYVSRDINKFSYRRANSGSFTSWVDLWDSLNLPSESGNFTPLCVGGGSAGSGTYTAQVGSYYRIGRVVHFKLSISWSAHTGTGAMIISGLPFTSSSSSDNVVLACYYDGLTVGAGRTAVPLILNSSTSVTMRSCEPGGGGFANINMDSSVAALRISGSYII